MKARANARPSVVARKSFAQFLVSGPPLASVVRRLFTAFKAVGNSQFHARAEFAARLVDFLIDRLTQMRRQR